MAIQIVNTLSKKKEELVPLQGKKINMYSCGVTVYDQCHIGHARSLFIFDVIRRYLKYRGYEVHFVRNITDIDDKIINKAKETGKTSDQVAKENIETYYRDLKSLGVDVADIEPRATDNIPGMIEDIQKLILEGFAYEVHGDVYYNVRKFQTYGKLSGQSIDQMMEAVRIDKDTSKNDPLDFALWKKSQEGEPFWNSPWGKGRPGWHIECSCMSLRHLKCQTLDIHAGGRDLVFPHHENEIAQAEPITHKPFAKYWIHHGLLTINGQKMSKSLGNFITIQDVLKKHSVNDLKMFFLASHYASPIDYTEEKMLDAAKAMQKIDILFWKAAEIIKGKDVQEVRAEFIDKAKERFLSAMDDDFNTAMALGCLFEFINETNKFIDQKKEDQDFTDVVFTAVSVIEDWTRNILGLFSNEEDKQLGAEEEKLISERQNARANKDFKRSDELRDVLRSRGIAVEDTKNGQTWRWV